MLKISYRNQFKKELKQQEFYLRKAKEKKVTCKAAFTMRNLCKLKGDESQKEVER